MQRIVVLVGFTDGSAGAIKQAEQLGRKTGASIIALHVTGSNAEIASATEKLEAFISTHGTGNMQAEVVAGGLMEAVPLALKKIEPDLVIICSHGIKGIAQHLFGSKILHLAEGIRYPMIIVHENNKINLSEVKSILFPLGPHTQFDVKIRQTAKLAQVLGATVVMYEIEVPGMGANDILETNKAAARKYFEEMKVDSEYVFEEMKMLSAGFSRQTLAYAVETSIPLISLMATVSKNDMRYGAGDKESLVNNPNGVPVLLCMA